MNTRRKLLFVIHPPAFFAWFIVSAILLGQILLGQTVDSALIGTVTDPSGAVVANTRITAVHKATGVSYGSTANAVGQYRVLHLPVGTYDVTAAAPNFVDSRVEGVALQLNRTSTVDFSLMLPTQTTTVQVRQSQAPIDAAGAQLQITFESRAVMDVPSAATGSGVYNLSLLGAGVASPGGLGLGVGPSVAGQRPTGNRYYVEGTDNNSYFAPGPLGYISNEAVGEVTLLQNHFGAEFGGATGGIFNAVLKSGGNQLHGGLYEYMQNRNLNAIDAQFANTGSPRFDANRFGGSLSGPIVKNKIFYFADFEYNPVGRATTIGNPVSAPTQAGYQILDGLSGISKTNLQVLEKYLAPAPAAAANTTVLGNVIPTGPVSIVGPSYSNGRYAAGNLDWNVSNHDQVRGRYIFSGIDGIDPNSASTLPAFYANLPANAHFLSLSEFHTFTATLQNEFRAAYSHGNTRRVAPGGLAFPGLDSFPTLTFVDLGLQVGPNASVPNGIEQGMLQLADGVVKIVGRHTIKAGYDFRDMILTASSVSNPRGLYNYNSLERYLRDLSPDGATSSRTLGTTGPLVGGFPAGFLQNAAYVEDSFRMRPNLTLDLGVRYEYVTVPVVSRAQSYSSIADVPGVLTFRAPSSSVNDWSPRVGFAYSPKGSSLWVIRGGFSRSFDMPYSNIAVNTLPAFYGGSSTISPNVTTPNFLANGGAPVLPLATDPAAARAGITGYTPDQNRPYALNYTLGVQRLLGNDYTIEARYIGSRGVHLYVQDQLSRFSVVTPTQNIPTFLTMPSPEQLAGLTTTLGYLNALAKVDRNPWATLGFTNTITSYEPRGNSQYHGLALQVTRRYSRNLSMLWAYTWSHAMDDSTATVNTTVLTPRRPQDFQNMSSEWASSMLDRRHRLTITPIFDITPFSHQRNWVLKNVVGNWSAAFTYTYESPEYATVQSNIDANLNGDSTPDRAIVNPGGVWNAGTDVTPLDRNGSAVATSSASIVAYVAKDSNARYIVARSGAYANAGRNTFPLDPINNVDASIRKVFQIGEGKRLELGAQFYNLFNHPQFTPGFIDDVYVSKSSNRNYLIPNNADFGQYQKYFFSNARWAQIVGRFTF